jgi:autotransporter adhesin
MFQEHMFMDSGGDMKRKNGNGRVRRHSLLCGCAILASTTGFVAPPAHAQLSQPVVNACSGLRLPRSAVTDILAPVANGIVAPVEDRVNSILGVIQIIPLVGQVLPPLDTNVAGLLSSAAAGDPISLQVFDTDGNAVDPAAGCNIAADTLSLADEGGIAIGGNRIEGLGANGRAASAGEIDSIAFGNGATTAAAATGAIAIGTSAQASAANSVAIGAGSVAARGPQLAYAAIGLPDPQLSAGEFSVGAAGAERQITNVAAGSAATDAVNVAQLQGVADRVTQLGADALQYDGPARDRVSLAGAGGTVIDGLAPGRIAADSREAVNGAQLNATNGAVNALDTQVTANTNAIANLTSQVNAGAGAGAATPGPVRYADAAAPGVANDGTPTDEAVLAGASGGPVGLHNVRDGTLAAGSTDAVNGGQLAATNSQVAQNSAGIADLDTRVATNTTAIADVSSRVDSIADSVTGSTVVPVQYADAATPTTPNGGTISDDVTLVGAGDGPVGLHNVAAGIADTDAVNIGQVRTGLDNAVAAANDYTDLRIDALGADMTRIRRDANGGIAGALAVAALPQASDPGRGMVGFGFGTFQGQSAFALGLSARTRDGRVVVRAGATVDTRGRAGGNAGVGLQF